MELIAVRESYQSEIESLESNMTYVSSELEKLETYFVLSEFYQYYAIADYLLSLDEEHLIKSLQRSIEYKLSALKNRLSHNSINKYYCASNLGAIYSSLIVGEVGLTKELINNSSKVFEQDYELFEDFQFAQLIHGLVVNNFSLTPELVNIFDAWADSEIESEPEKVAIFKSIIEKNSEALHLAVVDYSQAYNMKIEKKWLFAIVKDEELTIKKYCSYELAGYLSIALKTGLIIKDDYSLNPFKFLLKSNPDL